jgi:hypothetical protein
MTGRFDTAGSEHGTDWLEFRDLKRRRYNSQVWIPVRAAHERVITGEEHCVGYEAEYLLAMAFAVPIDDLSELEGADANDLIHAGEAAYVGEDGRYVPADTVKAFYEDVDGLRLVLDRRIPGTDRREWVLNQDVVFALNLLRVGDNWVRVDEGRVEVARLVRDHDGEPSLFEFNAEFLKDYLKARGMGAFLGTFVQRTAVVRDDPEDLDWERPVAFEENMDEHWRWRGDVTAIHEGSVYSFGDSMAVLHIKRTDFDGQDEVPTLDPVGPIETKKWSVPLGEGPRAFRVTGEIWRTEWISPAAASPRVADEKIASTSYFIVDANGSKANGDEIKRRGNLWLWFKPEVVIDALAFQDGRLSWYTAETGSLRFSPDGAVHFGVNEKGFINTLAVDIGRLPLWDQARWAGRNVAPSGTVSSELVDAQVRAEPARTSAPENALVPVMERLGEAVKGHYGIDLYHGSASPDLLRVVHRFRATDSASLYALAKDIDRIFADRIDAVALQTKSVGKNDQLKSLKALERALATLVSEDAARMLGRALSGIRDLRLADAHPTSSEMDDALERANIDKREPFTTQAREMLIAFVVSLSEIAEIIELTSPKLLRAEHITD